jgi:hypothetical protein
MDSVDRNRLFDDLDDAEAAVKEALPAVIARHRSAGILTWALLHQIEDEVIEAAAASGECDRGILTYCGPPRLSAILAMTSQFPSKDMRLCRPLFR